MVQSIRRAPLIDSICERLLQDHGEDEWLPAERQLAAVLGVSRPALREAIKRLETQGLLVSKHGVGVQVVDLPHTPVQAVLRRVLPVAGERIRQFTVARRLIEPELAALAAQHARVKDLKDLRAAHTRFMDPDASIAGAIEADLEFHRLIARAACNRVLSLMFASMVSLETESRQATLSGVGLVTARRHHTDILQAIVAGDEAAARTAMLGHLDFALTSLSSS